MPNDTKENGEKKGGEEEKDVDLTEEQINAVKDEEARGLLSSTIGQKKHWREKASKAEERLAAAEKRAKELEDAAAKATKQSGGDNKADELEARILETNSILRKYPDLTDEELVEARDLAKVKGKKVKEIVESPMFQAFLKSRRDAEAAERAKASPSNRTGNPTDGYSLDDLEDPVKVRKMHPDVYRKLSDQKAEAQKHKS